MDDKISRVGPVQLIKTKGFRYVLEELSGSADNCPVSYDDAVAQCKQLYDKFASDSNKAAVESGHKNLTELIKVNSSDVDDGDFALLVIDELREIYLGIRRGRLSVDISGNGDVKIKQHLSDGEVKVYDEPKGIHFQGLPIVNDSIKDLTNDHLVKFVCSLCNDESDWIDLLSKREFTDCITIAKFFLLC